MITDQEILNCFIKNNRINCKKLAKSYLLKHYNLLEYLLNRYSDNYSINNISEILYRIKNNINETPRCICGNILKYYSFGKGYQKHCCPRCAVNDPIVQKKIKNTCLEKYGTEYANQSMIVKNKIKQTNIERYGVENVYQSNIIKEQIKQTNLERYGVEYPAQNKEIQNKQRITNLERYGVEYFDKEKVKQAFLDKYGVENSMQVEEIKLKQQNTMVERYGQATSWNHGILREKQYQTCIEKYGVKYYTQSDEFRQWNSEHMKSPEIQKKILETKRKNNSFHSSKLEQEFKNYLEQKYINDIEFQYKSKLYPFNCDFYIKSLDLYIEIQGDWRHGFHPFDENNQDDINRLEKLKALEYEKLIINKHHKTDYTNAIITWTIRDPQKRKMAKDNNLNYLEIFSNNINEAIQIFEEYINNLNN